MCSPPAAPQPGPAAELRAGDLRGGPAGGRRGAEGQPVLPASLSMKGLLCVGSGSGRGRETSSDGPSSPSKAHLAPACQPRAEGRDGGWGGPGGLLALTHPTPASVSPASCGQMPPLSAGTPCLQPPLPGSSSCWAAHPVSGPPTQGGKEAGEPWDQSPG